MIKPDPMPMTNESGRNFAIELLKHVKVLKSDKEEEAQ